MLPTTALLALTPVGPELAPPLTQAISWAEALHEALLRLSDPGDDRGPSRCFGGRDEFGQPLTGHQHAAVMPLALDSENRIDHALVHAAMGLDEMARIALARLERVWIAPGSSTLQVALTSLGQHGELAPRLPALRAFTTWRSVTPFVPSRHVKTRGQNSLEEQIQAELESWGFPRASTIDVDTDRHWRTFWLRRRDATKKPPVHIGFGIRLAFAAPVRGPLNLGYGAHFGMGQLQPADACAQGSVPSLT